MIKLLAFLLLLWGHAALGVGKHQFADFFASFESLQADFMQNTYNDTDTLIDATKGTFSFQRPQQLLWHTTSPNEQILLLNNNALWLVDVELEQASLQRTQALEKTPLYWLINKPNSMAKIPQFSHSQAGIDWYVAPAQSQTLSFGFKGKQLHSILLKNALDQTVLIIFNRMVINPDFKPATFKLNLGAEFDIIR